MRSSTGISAWHGWRYDGALLTVLSLTLLSALWPWFSRFAVAGISAGVLLALLLARHQRYIGAAGDFGRLPELNLSAIHVGGDVGGLIFVSGTVVIFLISVPSLRAFALASMALSAVAGLVLVAWRKTHSPWSAKGDSILGR